MSEPDREWLEKWAEDATETLGDPFDVRVLMEHPDPEMTFTATVGGEEYEITLVLSHLDRERWPHLLDRMPERVDTVERERLGRLGA